jgi:hypothetical protein
MEPKRGPGRPRGTDYPVARTMLLTIEDYESLRRIAEVWECSATEAVRRLIREKAKRIKRAEQ